MFCHVFCPSAQINPPNLGRGPPHTSWAHSISAVGNQLVSSRTRAPQLHYHTLAHFDWNVTLSTSPSQSTMSVHTLHARSSLRWDNSRTRKKRCVYGQNQARVSGRSAVSASCVCALQMPHRCQLDRKARRRHGDCQDFPMHETCNDR
jgi:hypothetical protein